MEYEFDHRHPPKLKVKQGESFIVNTEDAASGFIRSTDVAPHIADFPIRKFEPPKSNPIGGPVYVEGAQKGDLLEVTIERIVMDSVETQPLYDVISQLVYATGRQQVTDVWIAGQRVLRDRVLINVDHGELMVRAESWRALIHERLAEDED